MIRPSIVDASPSGSLSRCSASVRSDWYASCSAAFRVSASSRRRCASSACDSASEIIRLTSSSVRPEPPSIRICCSLPVPRSFADTLMIPFASMSKDTSICGIPRIAGGIPTSWNFPSVLLNETISDSPWATWISTDGWLSSAVVKVSDFRVGMVVLRSMSFVKTPPCVSMPSESGVTSRSRTSLTSPFRTPAWMAAPTATTSSGFTPLCGSLPMSSFTFAWTAGIRVIPPTSTTCVDVGGGQTRIRERLLRRLDGALEQVVRELVELRARELEVEVLRALGSRRDEGQVDLRRHRRGELDLRLLARLVEALQRHRVLTEVDSLIALELRDHPVDDRLVEVVAAEVVVPVRRLDVVDALAELEHGDVEGAPAEVEDEDRVLGASLSRP